MCVCLMGFVQHCVYYGKILGIIGKHKYLSNNDDRLRKAPDVFLKASDVLRFYPMMSDHNRLHTKVTNLAQSLPNLQLQLLFTCLRPPAHKQITFIHNNLIRHTVLNISKLKKNNRNRTATAPNRFELFFLYI